MRRIGGLNVLTPPRWKLPIRALCALSARYRIIACLIAVMATVREQEIILEPILEPIHTPMQASIRQLAMALMGHRVTAHRVTARKVMARRVMGLIWLAPI